ncbi:IclR family transcriptional regulator [Bifidobacterium sp. ESL0784]|uniref:IclR family transcriptional regulator n=1 Tax=Bifidobacterium sp. ESL0784 TaxID=2983231 RepID=UPI0023F89F8C|nr:IclR family transcriptional regulator [Bifidobacterium sp. ESL0784]MDF7640160.1 IclR family transcriptional regulator [Bifidobacterium sp. ESL0784]
MDYMDGNEAPAGTQTLMHGIAVLRAVSDGARNLKEIVASTHLNRSTAHRLVQALCSERFLRDEGRSGLSLGPALIELGFKARDSISIQEVARPYLVDLGHETKDTIHLAIEDGGSVLYLDKIHGQRGVEIRSWPGCRMPLTYTGIGKALLIDDSKRWTSQYLQDRSLQDRSPEHDYANANIFANAMAKFARQGFAYDLEENQKYIRCVGAPIKGVNGKIIAAISISAIATFMPTERMRKLGVRIKQYAKEISEEMGYRISDDISTKSES